MPGFAWSVIIEALPTILIFGRPASDIVSATFLGCAKSQILAYDPPSSTPQEVGAM
jgi:hypothetical protein